MGDSPALKTQRPYMVGPGFMKTIPLCNYRLEAGPPQVIRDVRGGADGEKAFHLAEQGFSFRPWHPTEIDWDDEGQIERTYLPEVKELLREELGLGDAFKRCEVFDWRVSVQYMHRRGGQQYGPPVKLPKSERPGLTLG